MTAAANPYGQRNDGGRCICSECGQTFGGLEGFDRHRINMTGQPGYDDGYDWRCTTDPELERRGLHCNGKGWWVRAVDGSLRSAPEHQGPSGRATVGAGP